MTSPDPTRFRRGLASCAALGLILTLAATAAGQNPPLGSPDAPPPVTESVAPPAPVPDEPVAPVVPSSPSPAPASPAPSSPSSPSSAPADPSPSAAAAAAARRRLQQRRAAEAEAEAAERRQALRKVPAVAGRVDAAASTVHRAGLAATADALAASEADAPDDGGRGNIVLFALLVAAVVGIGLAAFSRLAGRPGAVERFRLELVGVSVACMLTVALVLAGVV